MRFEDDALRPAVEALVVRAAQPRQPVAEMQYVIEGHGRYTVLEQGDRLVSEVSAAEAIETVTTRSRARLLDHLSLGGWTAARATIASADDGQRVLVLGRADADDVVFFRAGVAVALPKPASSEIVEGPVASVALVEPDANPGSRLNTGEIVEALATATLPSWKPAGDVFRACVQLVGSVEGYRVPAPA